MELQDKIDNPGKEHVGNLAIDSETGQTWTVVENFVCGSGDIRVHRYYGCEHDHWMEYSWDEINPATTQPTFHMTG